METLLAHSRLSTNLGRSPLSPHVCRGYYLKENDMCVGGRVCVCARVHGAHVWHNLRRGHCCLGRSHRLHHVCTISENQSPPLRPLRVSRAAVLRWLVSKRQLSHASHVHHIPFKCVFICFDLFPTSKVPAKACLTTLKSPGAPLIPHRHSPALEKYGKIWTNMDKL